MVIFHGYVSLPEGKPHTSKMVWMQFSLLLFRLPLRFFLPLLRLRDLSGGGMFELQSRNEQLSSQVGMDISVQITHFLAPFPDQEPARAALLLLPLAF